MFIDFEEEEGQRATLFRDECIHITPSVQQQQRGQVEDAADGLDCAAGQAQERGQQRDAPADRFEQIIEERSRGDIARHLDEVDRETQLEQALVRKDVGRRACGVAMDDQPAADEALSEDPGQ